MAGVAVPLSEFTKPGADPVAIIQRYRRRGVSMTDLVKSFTRPENKIQEELVQLINDHYSEFIGLSTKMEDVSRKTARLRPPLSAALESSTASTTTAKGMVDQAEALMKEKEKIRRERSLLRLYKDNRALLSKISGRLAAASSPSNDHLTLAGYAALENSAIELTRIELALAEAQSTTSADTSGESEATKYVDSLRADLTTTRDQLHQTLLRELNHLLKVFAEAPSEDPSSVSSMCLIATCRGLVNLGHTSDIWSSVVSTLVEEQLKDIAGSEQGGLTVASSGAAAAVLLTPFFEKVKAVFGSQTNALAKLNECLKGVEGLHLLPECLLRPVLIDVQQRVPSVFMPTYPVQFAENYAAAQDFIRGVGAGHEPYLMTASWLTAFEAKWKTNVYFSLRQREIAQQVRKELFTREDNPLAILRSQIWKDPGALAQLMPQLIPRCLHLTCDLLSAWQGHISSQTMSGSTDPGLALSFCKDLSVVAGELEPDTVGGLGSDIVKIAGEEMTDGVTQLLALCIDRLKRQVSEVEACLMKSLVDAVVPKLEGVKQIPVLYRMTAKSAPTTHSAYVDNASSILTDFAQKYSKDYSDEVNKVLIRVGDQCAEGFAERCKAVLEKEESLSRFTHQTKGSAASSEFSDIDKLRAQLWLDASHFIAALPKTESSSIQALRDATKSGKLVTDRYIQTTAV
ncbi:hypothetical protein FOZ60_003615 [Perkinsus olseni]|uniref:Conserved oligomeric Golgi complex subunit 2 n=2 Tax=Perkinsus olseni TaxID=32597 RepID=A0A7J6NV10_PEROL|nr:hypothetical protein FOZ60_003615 [Perkinsus olseni]